MNDEFRSTPFANHVHPSFNSFSQSFIAHFSITKHLNVSKRFQVQHSWMEEMSYNSISRRFMCFSESKEIVINTTFYFHLLHYIFDIAVTFEYMYCYVHFYNICFVLLFQMFFILWVHFSRKQRYRNYSCFEKLVTFSS